MPSDRAQKMRQRAFGNDARSAAIELLLRAQLAEESHPWVEHDRAWDTWAFDFDALLETSTALDSEHRTRTVTPSHLAVLSIAASPADNSLLQLRALLPSLDHEHTERVMIAITHAAGCTRFTTSTDTTRNTFQSPPPLATWPDEPTPPHS